MLDFLGSIGSLPSLKKWKSRQISSYDRTLGNKDYISIPPKEMAVIGEVEGSGRVARTWFTIMSKDPLILRKVVLRFYWDGEDDPSVETPFGDFFGVGFGEYSHHHSLIQGMTSGGYFSYWPMPFGDGARFEVHNLSDEPVSHLYFNIQYHEENEMEATRFHAKWRRENPTTIGRNYTILQARGRGHFAGCLLNMQSYCKGSLLMLQGDEMIYVDGEDFPSIRGTGTEDYFQGGWFWTEGCFSAPFHGLTLGDMVNSRFSAYRLHIPDAIPFTESIRVTIEHGHDNMLQQDYSSLAYWYQTEPHNPMFGHISDDVAYLIPLGTKSGAYLMSEVVQDPPENIERRRTIHQAANLRLQLRQAKTRGVIPSEFEGVTEEEFMRADYDGLRKLVEKVGERRSRLTT